MIGRDTPFGPLSGVDCASWFRALGRLLTPVLLPWVLTVFGLCLTVPFPSIIIVRDPIIGSNISQCGLPVQISLSSKLSRPSVKGEGIRKLEMKKKFDQTQKETSEKMIFLHDQDLPEWPATMPKIEAKSKQMKAKYIRLGGTSTGITWTDTPI